MNPSIGILGGGISGIALGAHLKTPFHILEQDRRPGGLCASVQEEGFTFDAAGPHIMFSKNKEVLGRMVEVLGENVHQKRRENKIWFKGRFVKYPFENGLSDLELQDNFECILSYLQNPWTGDPGNLAEWAYATFGQGISDKYFLPYNAKIWNVDPREITLEWVSRIPKPPLEDVLRGAIGIPTEGYLHQLFFHYPILGGYESLVKAFQSLLPEQSLTTACAVLRIKGGPGNWQVETAQGLFRFETLVSTLPIHELARIWDDFPSGVLDRLRYNSLINVLLGLEGEQDHGYTALYVPDADIPFHRLSYPRSFSEHCVPQGHSSIMAEITFGPADRVAAMTSAEILADTEAHLQRMGLVDPSAIVYRKVLRFEYGYPIYDKDYFTQVALMRGAVADRGIHLLGRFAEFDYINSDVCVERAIRLASTLDRP